MQQFSLRRGVRNNRTSLISRTRRCRRRYVMETLESRTLLAATITATVSGNNVDLNWTGDTTADNVTLTYNFNSLYYSFNDPGHTINVSGPDISVLNNGTSDVMIAPSPSPPFIIKSIFFTDGTASGNIYNLQGNFGGPVGIIGPSSGTFADTVIVGGGPAGVGAGLPTTTISNYTGTRTAALTIDDDLGSSGTTYAMTSSTVSVAGNTVASFSGQSLTYLSLDTPRSGSATVNVTGTPAAATGTFVNGSSGGNTINVLGTGTGSTLFVLAGDVTNQASTVNVVANSESVDITSFATAPAVTTVNVGSTGGAGSMAGIQGPISVVNATSFTSLNFHDETDTTGQTWTLNNDDGTFTGSVAVTGSATTSYDPDDLSQLTVNGGSGGNAFIVNDTSGFYATTLNTGTGDDDTHVYATGDNTLNINGQNGTDTVTLGGSGAAPLGMQGLNGTINVGNALGLTNLVLDDSQDTVGQTALLFNDSVNGSVTGLSPATINYTDTAADSMTVYGGSGGNTFTVDGTLDNPGFIPAPTDLYTGTGDDTTFVEATYANGPLNIHGQAGQDTVDIGFFGSLASILGPIFVDNDFGFTDLTADASTDLVSHDFTLSSSGADSTMVGLAPATITYVTFDMSSLTINTSDFGTQVMNIDMSGGNPIPYPDTPGLTWNAGADSTSASNSHALNIFGTLPTGPFASETHNANDQTVFPQVGQYGSIYFDDGQGTFSSSTSLFYTGLQPITDTTPATSYTFNDYGYPDQSFSATTGPIVGGFQTVQFANTPTPPTPLNFETTDIANKTNVVFNTPASVPVGAGIDGVVNIPTASVGLASLTFNTFTGNTNNVSFVNTPPGVVTSLFGGTGSDITDVTGPGVAASTVLFLNGGAGTNTLNYDAGGKIPTITPGLLPGEVLISIPGAGIVDAINYQHIHITGTSPLVITPGPAVSLTTAEGFQNVNTIVGTFTAPVLTLPGIPGLPASLFTASIDWGDPSPDPSAGKITQDASNPSVYYITGTHTFAENGTYTVANTVAFAGGSYTATVNGVPITITYPAAAATPGTSATATVTQGPLVVSTFPIVGTEGIAIPAAPIATFIDNGGSAPIGDYSTTIDVYNSAGTLVVSVPAVSITQNGSSKQYTVNAPAFTLPEEGSYRVAVTVTESGGATPIVTTGTSTATIADAPLTAGAALLLTSNTGVALPSGTVVGSFTDANPTAPISDFTATIDWGDGSPNSIGTITQPGGVGTPFDVTGGHKYAKSGSYSTTIVVKDVGGSTVTIFGSATVTDLPVTGSAHSFTTVENLDTGTIELGTFTDPNTLATVADVHATLPIGGWGDGTPTAVATLQVSKIGVDETTGDPIFEIFGSHTYADEGTFTLNINVTTLGGVTTALTPGTVTVLDAKLTPTTGNTITGVEGNSTGTVVLGSFTDDNQLATVADYTTGAGSVVVNWGDGSAPQTLTASNLTSIGTPNGVTWTISAAHTYTEEGTYSYSITVKDTGGAATIVDGSAVIADAPLTAGAPTALTPNTGVKLPGSTIVATFTDGNTFATTADYTTTIDWGDGSPESTGVVVATATPGVFDVEGPHIYAYPGVYTTLVTVHDDGGSHVVVPGSATVTDLPVSGSTADFTAVEDESTGLFVLATFTDPNTLATVADVNATLAIGGWGDTTPTSSGVNLVVQQIGTTPLTATTNPGDPIFEVLGTHTYAEESPPGTPYALSVIVTTVGGASTTITSPPGGGVTVLDAPLTSTNGTEITGIEGITTGTVLLGTFTDANQASTVADFTTGTGSVVVSWGDGSAPQTLTAANLTSVGSPDGVIWTVSAAHTYAEEGTYAYTVTVTDTGRSVTMFSGSAIIADAALTPAPTQPTVSTVEASIFPVPVFSPPLFKGEVASFTDANPTAPLTDFTATIDWGDGTPMTAGTVTQPGGVGTPFFVSGSHTYADSGVTTGTGNSGTYAIQVFVQDVGGSRVTVTNTATVADNSIALTGALNPASDSGLSTGTVDVTNVVQPNFTGTSEPLSTVTLSATLLPAGTPFIIGQAEAGSNGSWTITSDVVLADGHYSITATAVDQFGQTVTTIPPSPVVITPSLTIDTIGPVIDGMFFNRLNGQVDYIIQDPPLPNGSAPAGVWINTLLDSSNYLLTKVHPQKDFPGEWIVTNVTATPDPTIPYAYDVAVTFNSGKMIKGGFYDFTIRDSSNGNSSVQDLAENHLDGVFYGSFPSGNGINGSDFVARLEAYHNKVFAPQPVVGTASAANGGVGGATGTAVHSGVFVPVIPVGGSPIFSTTTGAVNAAKKGKGQTVIKIKHKPLVKQDAPKPKHEKVVLFTSHPKGPHRS